MEENTQEMKENPLNQEIQFIHNNEEKAEENRTKEVKLNGRDNDNRDLITSPIQSPGEIENMTVVDEDVELVSSSDENEKAINSDNENQSRKSKRKSVDSSAMQSKKKKHDVEHNDKNENDREVKKRGKTRDSGEKENQKALPLLEKYWKAVRDDPTDFTGWTYLLQYVDQANNVAAASEVYTDFLSRYPYCYGYWRKYADYLKKNKVKDKCQEIFEKGIKAIPLSVDLWIHYLNYVKETNIDDENTIRKLFERSLATCGLEFRSDRLWDAYIKWEVESGRLTNVTKIFDRWLCIPTQGYVFVMEKFKDHIKKNPPSKVLDPEEFFLLRNEVLCETKASNKEIDSKLSDDAPPGEENPDKIDKMNEEETKALKEKIINKRKEKYEVTQKEALARWSFEENIKRPYFHVKPLEQSQLNNWKEYLDFEIKEGNKERIILLFERCLIACALYEEFWLKFADYLLSQPEVPVDKVRDIFVRACTIHHPKKLNVHLKWAAFEETHGNSLKAALILETFEKINPNLLVVILRRLNVIRRRGEYEKVCSLYERYIETTAVEKKEMSVTLSIKYARFCCRILNDVQKAVDILKAAMDKDKNNLRLVTQLIDTLMCRTPIDTEEIVNVLDNVINNVEDQDKKLLFCQRKLEFLEEFSEDCTGVQKAQDSYDDLLKIVAEKKKTAEEKKVEQSSKKMPTVEESSHVAQTTLYSATSAQPFYQQPPPTAYQTYSQGYMTGTYPQQNVYQSDPNYGYQNWQSYGYNQQWVTGNNPQTNSSGGYNYMY